MPVRTSGQQQQEAPHRGPGWGGPAELRAAGLGPQPDSHQGATRALGSCGDGQAAKEEGQEAGGAFEPRSPAGSQVGFGLNLKASMFPKLSLPLN